MNLSRLLKHLSMPAWLARRHFPRAARRVIADTVSASERLHRGELRCVIEGPLALSALWRDVTPRARAIELFSRLRVWDTEENSGVLIYIQLVDRRVEILADRGIAARVPQTEWDALCRGMETAFRAGDFGPGVQAAIAGATQLLAEHFPAGEGNPNELPDAPLIL